jgi:excisionase family DNA binding protein
MSAYLTAAAVADELGVSTRTVLRWIERGDLAAVRLPGGRLRVSQIALAERVASWSTTTPGRVPYPQDSDSVGVTPT